MKPAIALVLILLAGCTTTEPYRTSGAPCTARPSVDCSRSILVTEHADTDSEYEMAFLEYDDQGQLHTPRRPVRGEDGISDVGSSVIMDRLSSLAAKEDIFLIAYIHGWHHNANNSPEDSNVKNFRDLLAIASQIDKRKVFGVYIGWRGRALPGILDYSTFWNRKSTAQEVGYQGITEALLEIEHVVKAGRDRNRMVSIGHSFGGAALSRQWMRFLPKDTWRAGGRTRLPKSRASGISCCCSTRHSKLCGTRPFSIWRRMDAAHTPTTRSHDSWYSALTTTSPSE